MGEDFQIVRAKRQEPDVHQLLIQSEEHANSLYPPEGVFMLSLDEMDRPNVHLFVIRNQAGEAKGCGAIVLNNDKSAEIKRMFIRDDARGNGLGKRILRKLEDVATKNGVELIQLETGPLQPEAIKMYESFGYHHRGPFGEYQENEMSVFMEKKLTNY